MPNDNQMTETIQVAVYWPDEGYGIPETAPDIEAARYTAERWSLLGYTTGKSEIHIIKTVREVTVYGRP